MARRTVAAMAAALCLAGLAAVRAQTPGAGQDIMPALLAEVRGLRAAMEQMAAAGPRVQLALGRLQLQEQRLATSVRRLEEVRTRLTGTQQSVVDQQEQLAALELAAKDISPAAGAAKHGEQMTAEQLDEMQKQIKRQIDRSNNEVQRLIGEEATLANEASTEQARWAELNQRLEEIERSLAPRR